MRKPTLEDVLTISKILKKIGLDELKNIDTERSAEAVGKDVFFFALSKIDVIEDDFFKLTASICEVSVEEAKNISIDEFPALLDEMKALPGMADFFTRASALAASMK